MKLIVGGYAQGKLGYVVDKFEIEHSLILDGVLPEVGRYEGRDGLDLSSGETPPASPQV